VHIEETNTLNVSFIHTKKKLLEKLLKTDSDNLFNLQKSTKVSNFKWIQVLEQKG
jgi:hypothetical protein